MVKDYNIMTYRTLKEWKSPGYPNTKFVKSEDKRKIY